ncbi:hypothetical protein CC79DRAFT_493825 [Sarocladium strictum]
MGPDMPKPFSHAGEAARAEVAVPRGQAATTESARSVTEGRTKVACVRRQGDGQAEERTRLRELVVVVGSNHMVSGSPPEEAMRPSIKLRGRSLPRQLPGRASSAGAEHRTFHNAGERQRPLNPSMRNGSRLAPPTHTPSPTSAGCWRGHSLGKATLVCLVAHYVHFFVHLPIPRGVSSIAKTQGNGTYGYATSG